MHTARIDPSIVEIEERTHRYGEVDGFVIPSLRSQEPGILGRNSGRVMIDLVDKSEQRLVFLIQPGAIQIAKDTPDQLLAS